jgi:hypothetical protein
MAPIDDAVIAFEACALGEQSLLKDYALHFGVCRSTLGRRLKRQTASAEAKATSQLKLHPHHETALVQYIEDLTKRGLAPTRTMIRTFASEIAPTPVSESWVTRFLERNSDQLTSQWTSGIDAQRHKADSKLKYQLYFDLLHDKMKEHDVQPQHTYNMDEKGFMMGITGRSKRVFSKRQWERKEVRDTLQDGSREWITLLATICADGDVLPPGLIYQSAACTLQPDWVASVEVNKHDVFITSTPSGWSNNDVGLAWLEQVFDRCTREKARRGRDYRLLIVDGHGSHLTSDFIDYCNNHHILLAVFPPHATHTLQPLDVVMFKPLSTAYTTNLTTYLHQSQGLVPIKKGDFFPLFWKSWITSFKKDLVLKAFNATGIWPMEPEVILKRFTTPTLEDHEESTVQGQGYWQHTERLIRSAVHNNTSQESKELSLTFHQLQVKCDLLDVENKGLRHALTTKRRHKRKHKALDLQQRQEYHGGATFWSPRKIREARAREKVREREEQELQLQKANTKELKAAAKLYKKKIQEEKRVARERAKMVREKEKVERAERLAHARREKQQQKHAINATKALQLSQRSKRPASKKPILKKSRRRRVVGAASGATPAPAPPPPSPPKTASGRKVNLPSKFR